jgi:signal transduction histidine kinase
MFALPNLIRFSSGEWEFKDGSIISIPLELRDKYRIEQYKKITGSGWGYSEYNYAYFSKHLPTGELLIIPGLYIRGDLIKPSKKFYGYSASLTRQQVEQSISGLAAFLSRVTEETKRELSMLVHDLRALSNAIYSPAQEAVIQLDQGNIPETRKRIETVIAAQGILRMRTDALDLAGNILDSSGNARVPIFKKIDKVQRCFKSMAINQGKSISLSGSSFNYAVGHDVFELVPYLLIDNAVKYSPKGYDISVEVSDTNNSTKFAVRSYGPRILDHEKASIFEPHVRGEAALSSKIPGTGVGLNMAKKIVENVFSGDISCTQTGSPEFIDGMNYYETVFSVVIPSGN